MKSAEYNSFIGSLLGFRSIEEETNFHIFVLLPWDREANVFNSIFLTENNNIGSEGGTIYMDTLKKYYFTDLGTENIVGHYEYKVLYDARKNRN